MKKNISKKILFLSLTFFITIQSIMFIFLSNIDIDVEDNTSINDGLRSSLVVTMVIDIDDTNPAKAWAFHAANYDWCDFSDGVYSIENIIISNRCVGYDAAITIRNSQSQYKIENCTIINADNAKGGGIYLVNSSMGEIYDCTIYNCSKNGIYLKYSHNVEIDNNNITDINKADIGIKLNGSIDNVITNNNISLWMYGVYLKDGSNGTDIKENNRIYECADYAIAIENCSKSLIDDNKFHNNSEVIYITDQGGFSEDHLVSNNEFYNNTVSQSIIAVDETDKFKMLKNNFYSNIDSSGADIIHLEPGSSSNVNISDNRAWGNTNGFNGILGQDLINATMQNNYLEDVNYGIFIDSSGGVNNKYVEILDNIINTTQEPGIHLEQVTHLNIIGNFINNTASSKDGIAIYSSDNYSINENDIRDSGQNGIYLNACKNGSISNNYINNSALNGVRFVTSHNCTVKRNNIKNSVNHGISVESGSLNTTLYENLINKTGVNYDGIVVGAGCHSINIMRNIILNASDDGIWISDSNFCTVHWNDVNGSGDYGIWIDNCKYTNTTFNSVYYSSNYGIYYETMGATNWVYMNNFIKNRNSLGPLVSQGITEDGNLKLTNTTHGNYWANHKARYPSSQPNLTPNDYYWNFEYEVDTMVASVNDTRSLVEQTRGPLVWPFKDPLPPSLNVTAESALVTYVKCANIEAQWEIEYNGGATNLNYEIHINDTLVNSSSMTKIDAIAEGIIYHNDTFGIGDWDVELTVDDGMGLIDEDHILLRIIQPLTITVAEYPKTAFEAGNTTVIINWTVANDAALILTKLVLYINNTINATLLVGTETGHWNYSALKPYYVFNNLSLLPVGIYNIRILVYYTIDGNTCYWGSDTILINITEATGGSTGPGFIIPGFDLPIILSIVIISTIVLFRKKRRKIVQT